MKKTPGEDGPGPGGGQSRTPAAPADTLAGAGCLNPVVDPRDGAELRLERSGSERGDYAVPEARYGVGHRELLQLWCNTGRPIGIVRR
jgi:hypothetical protein